MGFWTDFLLNIVNIQLVVIFYEDKYWVFFLIWHTCVHMYVYMCLYTHTHTHKHIHFNSSWIKTVLKLCIVTLHTWRTKKKAPLICDHFRGCLTAGLFFTKVCILIHAYTVKFKHLQTANTEVLHIQCKHSNLQKYQKWQEELQDKIYLTKLKRFMCCGRMSFVLSMFCGWRNKDWLHLNTTTQFDCQVEGRGDKTCGILMLKQRWTFSLRSVIICSINKDIALPFEKVRCNIS